MLNHDDVLEQLVRLMVERGVPEVWRLLEVSEQTYNFWRTKYSG